MLESSSETSFERNCRMSNLTQNFGTETLNGTTPGTSSLLDAAPRTEKQRNEACFSDGDRERSNWNSNDVRNNGSSNQQDADSRSGLSNNNNYVNFNQFITQHNFNGSNNFIMNNGSLGGGGVSSANSFYGSGDGAYGGFVDNQNGLISNTPAYYSQSVGPNNMYANPFAYNLIPSLNMYDHNLANNRNYYYQGNASSSASVAAANLASTAQGYGNNNISKGFENPFANGVDNAKSSQLHASAQEFVPRFNLLALHDKIDLEAGTSGATAGSSSQIEHLERAKEQDFDLQPSNTVFEDQNNFQSKPSSSFNARDDANASPPSSSGGFENSSDSPSNNSFNRKNNKRGGGGGGGGGGSSGQSGMPGSDNYSLSSSNRKNQRNGRRSADIYEREDRFDNRNERFVSERYDRGERNNSRGNRQRYDNHRSNKRRDDWNRNRDRANGFRVEEKYANDNGSSSPLTSPEKKSSNSTNEPSPKKSPQQPYPDNEKLSQREKLIRDIETRRLECMVCVEPIKSYQSVWSCRSCYHIFHLQCIIKWAQSSKSDDGWRCPACQNILKEVPREYYCFCGKVKNPQFNRQDTAHSCGEVCARVEGCPHACTLLCHPGPCPPCQASVRRECGCAKTSKLMQCFLKEDFVCNAICGKLLNCELHTCTLTCHQGKCEPCPEKVEQHCNCGKQERQVACTRDSNDKHNYSCGKPCGKDLSCGNHKCKDCCHPGECRPCKLSPENVTSCPCGKMPIMSGDRKSCLDPIPTCEGVCHRTLRCGKPSNPHHCTAKCHLGNCPPCNKQTAVKCRCGLMDQMIKCRLLSTRADDARCKKRCTKKRSCGKHKCNQECCIDIDHICPLPCNYTLSCGKHKCDQSCHRGNCPPCYRSSFEELYCECGAEVIYPPVPCGTKRPPCKKPCSRSHPCDHPPQHNCHSGPTCPPCMILTAKWCFGKHEQRKTIPCSQESFSCGLACNKPLPCGRHKCIKPCHEGPCQAPGEICKQSCTKARPTCGHKCMAPCHEGDCPDLPCKEMVEVQCECGNRKQMRQCHDLVREYSRIATAQLASSMAEMQRGNYMELSEILAPVKVNKTNKTLDCNEECRLVERNRRLAIGLQIRNPDTQQKLLTKYSDFIRNFYKKDPSLVKSVHDALTNLVKLAKESKQKSRSHSFPTMNREKRQLVHEMCEMFGVESVAYDKEPNRNVVATASKDRSWLPATSIMEVMAREAGVRRVPVPSNNAWGLKR